MTMGDKAALAAAFVLATAAPVAWSADTAGDDAESMAPISITATRGSRGRSTSAIPGSVTVIDREEIEKQAHTTGDVGEILSHTVPGLGPSSQSLTNFGQNLRGRDFLILIDGVPQTTPLRDVSKQLRTISPNAIERIEVIRGAVATYGFGATGGIVNIITRGGPDMPEGDRMTTEFGFKGSATHADDSLGGFLSQSFSGRRGATDHMVNLHVEETGGYFDADGDRIAPDAFGQGGGRADSLEYDFQAKIGHQLTETQRLQVSLNHYDIEQDSDHVTDGDPSDPAFGVPGEPPGVNPGIRNTSITLDHTARDLWGGTLSSQLYYQDYETEFSFFPFYDTGPGQSALLSEKLGLRLAHDRAVFGNKSIVYGLDAHRDETSQSLLDGRTSVPRIEQFSYAPFLQVEVPVGSTWLLRGGARHERVELDVPTFTNETADPATRTTLQGGELDYHETVFNLGAVYYLTDAQEVFAGFSQGFSVADIGRVLRTASGDGTATSVEAADPEAQVVDNYEIGWRGYFGQVDLTASLFYNTSDLGTTFDNNLRLLRQEEEIYGAELTGDWRATDAMTLGGSVSYQEGEADTDDDGDVDAYLPATRISPPKLTLYGEYTPSGAWGARLQGTHFEDRDHDDYSAGFGGVDTEGYTLVDASVSLDAGPGRLSLGLDNLLNEDYDTVVGQVYGAGGRQFVPGRGRNLRVGYRLTY